MVIQYTTLVPLSGSHCLLPYGRHHLFILHVTFVFGSLSKEASKCGNFKHKYNNSVWNFTAYGIATMLSMPLSISPLFHAIAMISTKV